MKIISTSLLMVLALYCVAFGQIKGSTMGGLVTVVSDGPIDAGRNPALLIFSKQNNSIGILGRYRLVEEHDISFDAPLDVRQKGLDTTTAGLNVSAVFPLGKSVLGVSFADTGSDLYQRSESTIEFNAGSSLTRERSTEKSLNPALGASWCILLTDHSAIGFQLFFGYSRVSKETTKEYYQPVGTLLDRITVDEERTQTFGVAPAFGYLYHSGDSQVGLLLKGGSFTFTSERLDYTYRIPVYYRDSREYPFTFFYNGNISISAGAYKRINRFMGFAFEGTYSIQNSAYQKNLELKEDFDFDTALIRKSRSTTSKRPGVSLKGGVDFDLSSRFTLSAGGAYYYNEAMTVAGNFSEQTVSRLDIYLCTTGLNYKVNDDLWLILAFNGIYLDGEYDLNQSGLSLSLADEVFLFDAAIGCSVKF